MTTRTWIIVAVFFIVAIFAYDFLTKKPKRAPRWDELKATEEYASWKEFRSQNGRFEVRFPTYPQHTTASDAAHFGSNQDAVRYDIYLSQGRAGSTFLISVLDYPQAFDIARDDMLFDAVIKDMMSSNPSSNLVEAKKGTFLDKPSQDFTIRTPEFTTKSRAFVDNKTLYVLTVMDRTPDQLEEEFEMFTSSFKLTASEAVKQERTQEPTQPAQAHAA
jgi:hypothetical protein